MAELSTQRLRLRQWRDQDIPLFAAMNTDPEVMRYFVSVLAPEQSDALALRERDRIETRGWGLWAVEVAGVAPFIGFVGLAMADFAAPFTPALEVGWRLARPYWGRGYATEAAIAALDYAFTKLGADEVVSFTAAQNQPSRRVMERLGMTRDPEDDFDHPRVPAGHPIRRHVLYRISAGEARGLNPQSLQAMQVHYGQLASHL